MKIVRFVQRVLCGMAGLAMAAGAEDLPVKVFVLAGQSNMEGKAQNKLLDHQADAEGTRAQFAHLRKDGAWIVRDDVFIHYLNRHGGSTTGYGSPGRTGVELEFGNTMGDRFDGPVLLIKAAWGGHSLFQKFRPPSAGMPPGEKLQAELEQARKNTARNNGKHGRNDPEPVMADIIAAYGSSYRAMLEEVRKVQENVATLFPELAGRKLELAGFVWFQGWNDQYGGAEQEYASNLEHLIKDVRKDLGVPGLPVVIGVMGQNGSKPADGPMKVIQEAQLAMEEVPGFRGNVKAVRTDVLVDRAAEALYPTWKENVPEWEKVGSDHGYHYLGSAIWFNRMGKAFGEAMLGLLEDAE
ncbi:sialate O-acetylesterase [Luteolibacter marinus]|uniref:sialate O-acetylesterase n=1 Tax=Luteolibacter marinus TaxID=2776705 RepID=UPI001867FB34|nr:sialate O-acetylesterase [Luteolibacter marinus]